MSKVGDWQATTHTNSTTSSNAASTVILFNGGTNIAGTGDQFRYASTMMTCDGSITMRITSQGNTHVAANAGIMMRESLRWNSKHVSLLMTPTNSVESQQRSTTSAVATSTNAPASGPLVLFRRPSKPCRLLG